MRIAIAQMEFRAGHPQLNTEKIIKFIYEAKRKGADAIVFPDVAIYGRRLTDDLSKVLTDEIDACKQQITAASTGIDVVIGVLDQNDQNRKEFTIDNETRRFVLKDAVKSDDVPANTSTRSFLGRLISGRKPKIVVGGVGIDNIGKTIHLFDGGSTVFNSKGEAVLRAEPFTEQLLYIERDEIDKMSPLVDDETESAKIYRALTYGIKRYLELIGMNKIVIGASGGIDSAVGAALYTDVLGAENVYLINMPSQFNSLTTRGLAEQLAKNLGCQYMVASIQESVDATVSQLEATPIMLLSDDSRSMLEITSFVKENMQARDRSSRILAAVAAALSCGFTCNANKAETTIGYATLYGDCAGILAATADLWKYQVYALAEYINDEIHGREIIPRGTIDVVPSAELSTAQNVDEGKGDPVKYDYHDYLFKAFVEDQRLPEDILKWYADGRLEAEIGCDDGLIDKYFDTAEEFTTDLERWWRQYRGIAVAKRLQAPPILAVSARPFGFAESMDGVYYTRGYLTLKDILTK